MWLRNIARGVNTRYKVLQKIYDLSFGELSACRDESSLDNQNAINAIDEIINCWNRGEDFSPNDYEE